MFSLPALPSLPKLFGQNAKWLEKQQSSILSAATIITVFNIISALSGFVRDRLFITSFFDTANSSRDALDALLVAFEVPDFMYQMIIFGAMSAAFVPVFIQQRQESEDQAFKMTSTLMTWLLSIFIVFSILMFIFIEPITVMRTGHRFTHEQIEIVVNLTRIMIWGQLFLAVSSFLASILNSYQRFIMPALAPIFYNLGILFGIWFLSPYIGVYSAGVGVVIGGFIHMSAQIPFVRRLGFRFKPSFDLKTPGVKQIFRMTPPRLIAVLATELRGFILAFFTTTLGDSSVLIMELTRKVMSAPIRLFGIPISQASLPFLSEEVVKRDLQKLSDLVVQLFNQISFFIMPASVLVIILRLPIVRLLFGAENFPWETTLLTSYTVAIVGISIAAQGLTQLMIRAFYALKDTRTPLYIALIDTFLFTIMCAVGIFGFHQGVIALAIATSLTGLIELGLVVWMLNERLHCFVQKRFLVPQAKMLASSFFMAVFLYLPYRILDQVVFSTDRTIELIGLTVTTSTIGLLVYLYFSALFEVKELSFVTELFQTFGKWRKPLEKSPEVLVDTSVDGDPI